MNIFARKGDLTYVMSVRYICGKSFPYYAAPDAYSSFLLIIQHTMCTLPRTRNVSYYGTRVHTVYTHVVPYVVL